MNGSLTHPEQDHLEAFARGLLPPLQIDNVQRHLIDCPACCRVVDAVDDDDVLATVRRVDVLRRKSAAPSTLPLQQVPDASRLGSTRVPGCSPTSLLPPEFRNHPRYQLVERIGQGGMGDVYRAEHRLMRRTVAIKIIKRELTEDAQAVERFHREMQTAAALAHTNIVAAYDADQVGDSHFLAMEYVDGRDLADIVAKHGTLPVPEACHLILQAAKGIHHAHEQGLIHRDIKPHNLMVTSDGQLKVLDFGLALLTQAATDQAGIPAGETSSSPALTACGTVMGTPDYVSPEQATDARSADHRSDVYGLGATLFFLLVGEAPGRREELVDDTRNWVRTRICQARGDVPASVVAVVARMLAPAPSDRLQSMNEVAQALAPHSAQTPRVTLPSKESVGPAASFASRVSWPNWPLSPFLFIALAAAAVILYVQTDQGTLVIETNDQQLQIEIQDRSGQIVIVDTQTDSQVIRLRSGEYRIALRGDKNGVTLDKHRFKLTRGAQILVTAKLTADPREDQPGVASDDASKENRRQDVAAPLGKLDFEPGDNPPQLTGTYFPLALGNTWLYKGATGDVVIKVVGKIRVRSHDVFLTERWVGGNVTEFRIGTRDDGLYLYQDGLTKFEPPVRQIAFGVQVGDRWSWEGMRGTEDCRINFQLGRVPVSTAPMFGKPKLAVRQVDASTGEQLDLHLVDGIGVTLITGAASFLTEKPGVDWQLKRSQLHNGKKNVTPGSVLSRHQRFSNPAYRHDRGRFRQFKDRQALAAALTRVKLGMSSEEVMETVGSPYNRPDEPKSDGTVIWKMGRLQGDFPAFGVVVFNNSGEVVQVTGQQMGVAGLVSPPPPGEFDEPQLQRLLTELSRFRTADSNCWYYNPRHTIRLANQLHPLGKQKILQLLTEYVRVVAGPERTRLDRIRVLLRALLKLPRYPGHAPEFTNDVKPEIQARDFPPAPTVAVVHPVLLEVDDIPFFYRSLKNDLSGKKADTALPVVAELQHYTKYGVLRDAPFRPTLDPYTALDRLRESAAWNWLSAQERFAAESALNIQVVNMYDSVFKPDVDKQPNFIELGTNVLQQRHERLKKEFARLKIRWSAESANFELQ